jgi:rhodanese-related sulfurtransferase
LRKKKPECIGCGEHKLNIDTYDYSKYASCSTVNPPSEVKEVPWDEFLQEKIESQKILDVRPSNIYGIVHFLESENVPFEILKKMTKEEIFDLLKITDPAAMIPVSCARGITSKLAAEYLNNIGIRAVSISGGMKSYRKEIDQSLP